MLHDMLRLTILGIVRERRGQNTSLRQSSAFVPPYLPDHRIEAGI